MEEKEVIPGKDNKTEFLTSSLRNILEIMDHSFTWSQWFQ